MEYRYCSKSVQPPRPPDPKYDFKPSMGSSLSKRAGLTLLSPPAQSEAEAPMGLHRNRRDDKQSRARRIGIFSVK
jgi:hypothetical protein